jgi:hypothetical protein
VSVAILWYHENMDPKMKTLLEQIDLAELFEALERSYAQGTVVAVPLLTILAIIFTFVMSPGLVVPTVASVLFVTYVVIAVRHPYREVWKVATGRKV